MRVRWNRRRAMRTEDRGLRNACQAWTRSRDPADRSVHSRGARQGSPCRARRRARRQPRRHQGRVARPRPAAPPRPHRRRPGERAARDPPDGRDQRRLRGAHPGRRDHRGPAPRRERRRVGERHRDAAAGRRRGPSDAAARRPTKPTRPITGRLDLSGTIRPRNQTTTPPGSRMPLTGQPPLRIDRSVPELRASQPSGPAGARHGRRTTSGPSRPASTTPSSSSSTSASSTATPWARSRRSSRRTWTGWPAR